MPELNSEPRLNGEQQRDLLRTDDILPLVYEELRALADRYMSREPGGHTLQATALVHEAYLRLLGYDHQLFEDRSRFMAAVAVAMRRILIERARRQNALKYGGGRSRKSLAQVAVAAPEQSVDLLALEEALTKLAHFDADKCSIVTLRYLLGCSIEETAEALGISTAKVKRDWVFSRAWLRERLSDAANEDPRP